MPAILAVDRDRMAEQRPVSFGSMARTLLAIYPHAARRYDEMLDGGRQRAPALAALLRPPRRAWRRSEMRERLEFVDRRIRENGVTYNVYADPRAPTGRGSSIRCR